MYEGRVEFVSKSLEQLQETITRKEDNMRVVRDILMVVSRGFINHPTQPLPKETSFFSRNYNNNSKRPFRQARKQQ